MRKVTVYVTDEELAQLRCAAARRRSSLSRYLKERLMPSQLEDVLGPIPYGAALRPEGERRLFEAVRGVVTRGNRQVLQQLSMLMVMLDQFVLNALTHLPEIPEAQKEHALAVGECRHRGWQREVEDILRQLRGNAAGRNHHAGGNGAGV